MLIRQTMMTPSRGPHGVYMYDFHDEGHPEELLGAFQGFYLDGLFTDVSLQCSSSRVLRCHKVVLCARSSFFRAMFTADMREKTDSLIQLPALDVDILSALLDYIYSSRITITQLNVESLLKSADLLQFGVVKKACENFLVRLLDTDNCLGMLAFAKLHACPVLEKEAHRVLEGRFQEVIKEEEFLELDPDSLCAVTAGKSREVTAEAVGRWLAHDSHSRHGLLPSLKLDIGLEDLSNAMPKVHGNHHISTFQGVLSLKGVFKNPPRRTWHSKMIVVGGYHWRPLSEVQHWDLSSEVWVQGEHLPDHAKESYAVAILGSTIYISGGYRTNSTEELDAVWEYNCESNSWAEGVPLLRGRYSHCSVACGGCLYVIGGFTDMSAMAHTEAFDPLKQRWTAVADMVQGLGNASASVMENTIYVAGGHYGFKEGCIYNKIQSYKVDINQWSILTTCPHPEFGMRLVSLNSHLYLVGGETPLAERFDLETERWSPIASMREGRMECGVVTMRGCVYVTGGYSNSRGTYLQSMEKYDPRADSWDAVGDLPGALRLHGCVCVYLGV